MLFAIFNSIFVPLQVSFDSKLLQSLIFLVVNSTIDLFFFFDMLVSFRTEYIDRKGSVISDDKLMAINYIKTSFFVDVLVTVPFDTILQVS